MFFFKLPPLSWLIMSSLCIWGLVGISAYQYTSEFSSEYRIHFLKVALGDATLIQTPVGKNILIDTGSQEEIIQRLPKFLSTFSKNIDLLILSHNDEDHIGGSVAILKRFHVGEIFLLNTDKPTAIFQTFLQTAQAQKIPIIFPKSPQVYALDASTRMEYEFPLAVDACKSNPSWCSFFTNDSQVFRLSIFGQNILFTGDIETPQENTILLTGQSLSAPVLKVAHHGSKTSSSALFLDAVHPQFAVAMASIPNKFGHPHKEVIERIQEKHITFLQTGKVGDVSFCVGEINPVIHRCDNPL